MRQLVTLACQECKRRNYHTNKNKKNDPDRIELKKYCRWCGTHTVHKETRCQRNLLCSQGCSSIGRAPVSKTGGRGFESLQPCQ